MILIFFTFDINYNIYFVSLNYEGENEINIGICY